MQLISSELEVDDDADAEDEAVDEREDDDEREWERERWICLAFSGGLAIGFVALGVSLGEDRLGRPSGVVSVDLTTSVLHTIFLNFFYWWWDWD